MTPTAVRHPLQAWRMHSADRRAHAAARRWRHTGEEARWARSDLPARRLLARVFAVLFLAGAALFGYLAVGAPAADTGFDIATAAVCAVFAVVAAIDLAVIRRRMSEQRRWGRLP
jgi:ABC-type transport system involved in cytochrome bd biosynthesis fused ATPase/permease subunit